MKKILFVITLVVSLISCGKPPMEKDLNRENEILEIHFHAFKDEKSMITHLRNEGYDTPDNLLGFSIWSPQDNNCDVYYVTPRGVDDRNMLTLGHEVAHCIYGSFH
jgi:hypothetical protein